MIQTTSHTRLLGIIGSPVRHSLSPAMYNAAFRECSLDMSYFSFEIDPQELEPAVKGMTALGFAGFNVTHPYKEAIIPFLDILDGNAALIGAVNTVVIDGGKLHGYNTDGTGFIRSLREKGIGVSNRNILIIGAGGAAKAVGVALALSGANSITVANRNLERAEVLARIINGTGVKSGTVCTDILNWERQLQDIDMVINATPEGMYPMEDCCPVNVSAFSQDTVICDLVYNPRDTILLKEASYLGHITVGGLGMLLYQGVEAFELFTGLEAPVEAMRKALDVAT